MPENIAPNAHPQESFLTNEDAPSVQVERRNMALKWNTPENIKQRNQWLRETQVLQGDSEEEVSVPNKFLVLAFEDFLAGKNSEALQSIEKAISLDQKSLKGYRLKAMVHRFKGEIDESQKAAKKLIELCTAAESSYDEQVLKPGEVKNDEYLRAVKNAHADAYFQHGKAHRAKSPPDYLQAIDDQQQALKVLPTYIPALAELIDIYRNCPDRSMRNVEIAQEYTKKLDAAITERDAAEKEAEAAEKKQ